MRIVLVEDDLQLGQALNRALDQAGFDSIWVRRLADARNQLLLQEPALVILDLNLPDGMGFTLLEEIRGAGISLPVLIMTARDRLEDRLRGLDGGADDYLVKPFVVAELIARVRAIIRRSVGFGHDLWTFGDLTIDVNHHLVSVRDEPVPLTPTEYRLLIGLAQAAGRVVARGELIARVWSSSDEGSESALEVQVHGLRRKIGTVRVRTIRGVGYALEPG